MNEPVYPPPQKRRVWPWVLCGCLLLFVLSIAGCVGCASCTMALHHFDKSHDFHHSIPAPHNRYSNPSYNDKDTSSEIFTLDELKTAAADLPSTVKNERCSAGIFEVGIGKDIAPGIYFLEGTTDTESECYIFDSEDSGYCLDAALVYFGNYFIELDTDDVVIFKPNGNELHMYPIAESNFRPKAPYECGLYRVGTDIPAGTYTITANETASSAASQDSAAYVMTDLDFDDDSLIDECYVITGGSHTITVANNTYLELYAANATFVTDLPTY